MVSGRKGSGSVNQKSLINRYTKKQEAAGSATAKMEKNRAVQSKP